jgi:tRNA G10  N-methylase Trm11
MSYIAILGRQPALGIAELERLFGGQNVTIASSQSAKFEADNFDIQKCGGILKAGLIIDELSQNDWRNISQKIVNLYASKLSGVEHKVTLGISVYDATVSSREVQKLGVLIKQKLRKTGGSIRLVPNNETALSTATSHHNKLGLSPNKIELIIVRANNNSYVLAESTGSQNITAYANRDQNRPKRDAFVGMLPPKLAQIMINLACGQIKTNSPLTILDPFCGTGVVLQEALLMGYDSYGTDLSAKMIEYSHKNLEWLSDKQRTNFNYRLAEADAMTAQWQQPIDVVVGETYLGQPFSAPPSNVKLQEVVGNCNHIIATFLKNLAKQIDTGTPVCIAVPAWRDIHGNFTQLPLISTIAQYGYRPHEFTNISQNDLLYFRESQIVARKLLVLVRAD